MDRSTATDLDQATLELVRAGNHGAFASLVEAYQRPVYNLCYRLLGNASEAEEAAQETFLRAYAKRNSHDSNRPFRTWILSIAHHFCIDRLRRRRLTWVSLEDEPEPDAVVGRSRDLSPEDAAVRRERSDEVCAMVDSLPARYRSALVLRYWCDLSYEEIAQTTGTSVSAVKSRLHRARVQMADRVVASASARFLAPDSLKPSASDPCWQPA